MAKPTKEGGCTPPKNLPPNQKKTLTPEDKEWLRTEAKTRGLSVEEMRNVAIGELRGTQGAAGIKTAAGTWGTSYSISQESLDSVLKSDMPPITKDVVAGRISSEISRRSLAGRLGNKIGEAKRGSENPKKGN